MNYIIGGKVMYRSVDGMIRLLAEDENQSVILTPLVNKIFLILISRHGELVTREQIFEDVWQKAGLIASSHTLNQYVSTIRRVLSAYFDDIEVIITIPKMGYIFSNEITVLNEPLSKKIIPTTIIWLCFFILSILIIMAFSYCISMLISQPLNFMGNIGNCSITDTSGANNHGNRSTEISIAKYISQLADANCEPNVHFYFYAQESLHIKKKGGVMLAKCIEWKDSQNNCQTIYIENWHSK